MSNRKFLGLTVANITTWPEGFDYILNSKMDDVCHFFRKGEDYMEVASETPKRIPGSSIGLREAYSVVTKAEWEAASAVR